jgi:hypothetical protein
MSAKIMFTRFHVTGYSDKMLVMRTGDMVQVIEYLSNKHEALSSISKLQKKTDINNKIS